MMLIPIRAPLVTHCKEVFVWSPWSESSDSAVHHRSVTAERGNGKRGLLIKPCYCTGFRLNLSDQVSDRLELVTSGPLPHFVTLIRFASHRPCTGSPKNIYRAMTPTLTRDLRQRPAVFNCKCEMCRGFTYKAAREISTSRVPICIFYGIMFLGTTFLLPTLNRHILLILFYSISAI